MIGLLAAVRQPQHFASLIMIGPSPCYLNHAGYTGGFEREDIEGLLSLMDHNYLGWARQFAPAVMGNADRAELAAELEQSFCSTDPVTARTFARTTFFADNRADLPKLTRPSLILQVQEDSIVPLAIGTYLHEQLQDSQLAVLDASGHCPHISHPEATIRAMHEFLGTGHGAA
jgi:sigma-B regulation protein RsbQ